MTTLRQNSYPGLPPSIMKLCRSLRDEPVKGTIVGSVKLAQDARTEDGSGSTQHSRRYSTQNLIAVRRTMPRS